MAGLLAIAVGFLPQAAMHEFADCEAGYRVSKVIHGAILPWFRWCRRAAPCVKATLNKSRNGAWRAPEFGMGRKAQTTAMV
ncbi:hypothetical protein GCM10027343_32260 [Noviherbaspirillum agri]